MKLSAKGKIKVIVIALIVALSCFFAFIKKCNQGIDVVLDKMQKSENAPAAGNPDKKMTLKDIYKQRTGGKR